MIPHAPAAASTRATPASGAMLPRPARSRFGSSNPPTARERLPSVSLPTSPYPAASGAAPMPTPSSTTMIARLLIVRGTVVVHIAARQTRPESGQYFVGRKAARLRDVRDSEQIVAVTSDQRCHVAYLARDVGDVDHRHVHRDEARDMGAVPAHEHSSNVTQRSAIAVGVADRERRDAPRGVGTKRTSIADRIEIGRAHV